MASGAVAGDTTSVSVMVPSITNAATVAPVLDPPSTSSAMVVAAGAPLMFSTGRSFTAPTVIVTVAAELLMRLPSLAV